MNQGSGPLQSENILLDKLQEVETALNNRRRKEEEVNCRIVCSVHFK